MENQKNEKPTESVETIEAKFLGELRTTIREIQESYPDAIITSPKFINGMWIAEVKK